MRPSALARRGPAFAALEPVDEDAWARATAWAEGAVPPGPRRDERIAWLLVPSACWVLRQLQQAERRPLMVGVSAPQGAGKTTLTAQLVALLGEVFGLRAVSLSIDDFYLRRDEQLRLAATFPGNPYLEHRGYPGTHDVELGERVLTALRRGEDVDVPRYDKSAHAGRGDRSPVTTPVRGRVDVVLFEGWMLGFQPVPRVGDPYLAAPNERLAAYEAWHRQLDALLALRMKEPGQVVRWRIEAEQAMRANGKPGLSDAEVEDYVRRFLPAYATWAGTVNDGRWRGPRRLSFTLDGDRVPVAGEDRHV
jgi:D-glycerate 3-kinase